MRSFTEIFAKFSTWSRAALQGELVILSTGLARRAAYKRTYCSLQSLDDKELADLGIRRRDVQKAAYISAMREA